MQDPRQIKDDLFDKDGNGSGEGSNLSETYLAIELHSGTVVLLGGGGRLFGFVFNITKEKTSQVLLCLELIVLLREEMSYPTMKRIHSRRKHFYINVIT